MLEKMKYVNHINEVVEFGKNGLYINENDLRSFDLSYDVYNNDITNIRREIKGKKLPIVVVGSNYLNNLDAIINVSEKDVIDGIPGKLYIGDWYVEGYIVGSNPSGYTKRRDAKTTLNFVSISQCWMRPKLYTFRHSEHSGDEGLGYPYDYPYSYLSSVEVLNMVNSFYASADFIMKFYGPLTNPQISINDHTYSVTTEIDTNEVLTVNSIKKTIVLTEEDGTEVNKFADRDTSSYIFEKIPSGLNSLVASNTYDFDITLIEERRTPAWT